MSPDSRHWPPSYAPAQLSSVVLNAMRIAGQDVLTTVYDMQRDVYKVTLRGGSSVTIARAAVQAIERAPAQAAAMGSGWQASNFTVQRLVGADAPSPEPSPEPIPDAIDPIIGYRWFNVDTEGVYAGLLQSLHYSMTWEPGKAEKAVCRANEHDYGYADHVAPEEKCRCGIYALTDKTQLLLNYNQNSSWGRLSVLGTVKLWGKVIPADKGVRAQYALPTKLEIRMPTVAGFPSQKLWTADEAVAYLSKSYPDCEVSVISEKGIDDLVLDQLRGEVDKVAAKLAEEGISVEQAMDALKRSLGMVGLGGGAGPPPSASGGLPVSHVSLHTGAPAQLPSTPPFTPTQGYRSGDPTRGMPASWHSFKTQHGAMWVPSFDTPTSSRPRRIFAAIDRSFARAFGPWWVLVLLGLFGIASVILAAATGTWGLVTWVNCVIGPLNLGFGIKNFKVRHR